MAPVQLRVSSLVERLRSSLFLVPTAAVAGAVGGGLGMIAIDRRLDSGGTDLPLILASTVESARALLGTIAAATISFAGIAFSVSLLVIQLASTQYSPRVVHTLFRDPFNKRVMAAVVGTFTYCLVVLRSVRSPLEDGGDAVIPNLSVGVALVLGVLAILAVVAFINHNAHAMDVSEILERVSRDAVRQIRKEWQPADSGTRDTTMPDVGERPGRCVLFDRSGWVQLVDFDRLIKRVPEHATVVLHSYAGRYAVEGTAMCTVLHQGDSDSIPSDTELRETVVVGDTRTMQQDVSYGVRQLADVALRALSPGVNDPTTAQDAIFHLTAVVAESLRHSPIKSIHGDDGRTVLLCEAPDHVGLIRLAFEEIRRAAAGQPAVCIYLLEALRLLAESIKDDRWPEAVGQIRAQAGLVVTGCELSQLVPEDLASVRNAYRSRFG